MLIEAAASPVEPKGVLAGGAPLRLAIVAEKGCALASALVASGLFVTQVWWCKRAPEVKLSLTERIYRRIDRALFGQHNWPAPTGEVLSDDAALHAQQLSGSRLDAVLDLSCTLAFQVNGIPVLHLTAGSLPAGQLKSALRSVLGVMQGTAELRAVGADRVWFSAYACLDHRSLHRSLDWVLQKWPMVVLGALRRMQADQQVGDAAPPAQSPTAQLPPAGRAVPATQQLLRLLRQVWRRATGREQWRMHLYKGDPLAGTALPWVEIRPGADAFWADPFVIPEGDTHWVFFEELPFATGRGHLSVLPVHASGQVGAAAPVIQQPWHLSYPFLLRDEGRLLMIPESSANRSVDLYECEEFPHRWRLVHTLIRGLRLADATVVQWQGRWWMFAAHALPGASLFDELHIFSAESLRGTWVPHELNPVKIDARSARPAGACIVRDGRLLRPVQDCADTYGGAVLLQEVTRLDEHSFEERAVGRLILPDLSASNPVHTLNGFGGIFCVDSLHRVTRWLR